MKAKVSDKIFDVVNLIFVTLCLLIVLYPLIYVLSSSFSSPAAITGGKVRLLPIGFNINGYKAVFEHKQIWVGFKNSILYAGGMVFLNLIMTTMAAYPLSRKDFRQRNIVMYFFAFTMFFGGGLIPYYIVIKTLHMVNQPLVMIIPGAMSVFNLILMRTYIQTSIPESLQEAAFLDGCNDFRYLWSIVVPLSKPILAVISLYIAVASWNDYFTALIFINSDRLQPIQMILRSILVLNKVDEAMMSKIGDIKVLESRLGLQALLKYSLIVTASIPVLILYPFVQKYFVKGVTIGAIKG